MEREPSYYEVALTNRQVVVGFVVLLACVFTAFLSGVWVGRDAAPQAEAQLAEAAAAGQASREARLERLTFFGESGAGGKSATAGPRPVEAAPERATPIESRSDAESDPESDPESERMAQTLEAEIAAHRDEPPAAASQTAPPGTPTVAGQRVRRQPEPESAAVTATPAPAPARTETTRPSQATSPAAAPSAVAAPFWIQVYSSTNGARANEIAARLRRSQFQVRVLESPVGSGSTYRVRVGPYPSRPEADRAALRLRRDFRFDTWVTDQG